MIKILSQNLINQIAAGEVIERPASVIKELVENAIDAGATEVEIKIADAGKSLISVSDNGCGMNKDSLQLCILSHATSKLTNENLFDIHTFGFRGEALPSMVSIARVSITSANTNTGEAWTLEAEGTKEAIISIASRKRGTTVEIRDLFFATPARLKFLKANSTEADLCAQIVNRIALSSKNISFTLWDGDRQKLHYPAVDNLKKRIKDIFGQTFTENLFEVSTKQEDFALHGFMGVPTFNRSSSAAQYFFVNNRFVKDKVFATALKTAYSGLMPVGKFAAAILFLDIPYDEVDVNAHPAKTEIRFKENDKVRGFLISEMRKFIESYGGSRPTTEIVQNYQPKIIPDSSAVPNMPMPKIFKSDFEKPKNETPRLFNDFKKDFKTPFGPMGLSDSADLVYNSSTKGLKQNLSETKLPEFAAVETETPEIKAADLQINLGNALYQIAKTYIVAANEDNLIIVDQHAAAERITLEKLKANTQLDSQDLLLEEVCNLSESQVELFEKNADLIHKFGIVYEKLTQDQILVRALPSLLGSCEAKPLINSIAEELESWGEIYSLEEKIHHILATISCHGSLRAGRKLSIDEMNSLLRQMEQTPNIAQCCHGRPSYVVLSVTNLNKFFERT